MASSLVTSESHRYKLAALASCSSEREPVKQAEKGGAHVLQNSPSRADDSNALELRTRSDEATTTRCRKEKLLHAPALQQRCNVARGRSISPWTGIVSHFTVHVTCVQLARHCTPTGPRDNSCQNQLFLRPTCHRIDKAHVGRLPWCKKLLVKTYGFSA